MDIQSVKIACFIDVAKSNNCVAFHRYNSKVLNERPVPLLFVHMSRCPSVKLLRGVILAVYRVDGVEKQLCKLRTIRSLILSEIHVNLLKLRFILWVIPFILRHHYKVGKFLAPFQLAVRHPELISFAGRT